ncbi:MAG: SH3 domain-containing protein [Bacteroidales bacterium]|jgi:hypothetical protein|nr:SH3 domain-containing protein [Bacteroidales bacterium]
MRKILLFLIFNLVAYRAIADEFPWVNQIEFQDSTVWIAANDGLYRIDFRKEGKLELNKDDKCGCRLYIDKHNRLWKLFSGKNCRDLYIYEDGAWIQQKEQIISIFELDNDIYIETLSKTNYKYNKNTWIETPYIQRKQTDYVEAYSKKPINWKEILKKTNDIPKPMEQISALSVRNNGEIWIGGLEFVAYYYNNTWKRVFFLDIYKSYGTSIIIVENEEDIPPDDIDENDEDAMAEEYGDGGPSVVYFSDGRKTGFINDNDGYVNLRTEPNTKSPIIGIIFNEVKIFYWENANSNWWKVEINRIEGYVHKSRIKQK